MVVVAEEDDLDRLLVQTSEFADKLNCCEVEAQKFQNGSDEIHIEEYRIMSLPSMDAFDLKYNEMKSYWLQLA